MGDWKSALIYLELALKHEDSADTRSDASCAAWNVGDYKLSADHAREAVRLNPDSADLQVGLGLCEERLGNVDGAIIALRRASVLRPSSAEIWLRLGDCYASQNHVAEAEAAYREGGKRRTSHSHLCTLNLGKLLLQSKRRKEAQACFSKVSFAQSADEKLRAEASLLLQSTKRSPRDK